MSTLTTHPRPLCIVNAMLGKNLGGLEQAFVDYCTALAARGHKVHAVTHPAAPINKKISGLDKVLHHPIGWNLGQWDRLSHWRIRLYIKRLQPDIIITHGARAASLLRGMPCVVVGVSHSDSFGKLLKLDGIITLTPIMRQRVIVAGFPAEHSAIIPNMFMIPPQLPAIRAAAPESEVHIAALSRLVPEKGIDTLLHAFSMLHTRHPQWRLDIGGDGQERTALEALAKHLGIAEKTTFHGWLDDKAQFMAQADVLVMPSHWETFGITILEGFMHGVPVITTNTDGPASIIENGVTGVLFPTKNTQALADAIEQCMSNPEQRRRMAEAAQQKLQKYDMQHVSEQLEAALYQMIAAGRR